MRAPAPRARARARPRPRRPPALTRAPAQEVCNRAGGYSAKVQRNDVSQQKAAALDAFCAWVLDDAEELATLLATVADPAQLVEWIVDHKGTQDASDGRHYGHAVAGG